MTRIALYLKTLLKNEEINFFVEMCTDLADDPNELPGNIKYFLDNKLDLLVMSRYLKGSKIINWTIKRKLFSFLANKLAKSLLKIPVSDYTNGYRIYSKVLLGSYLDFGAGKKVNSLSLLELDTRLAVTYVVR